MSVAQTVSAIKRRHKQGPGAYARCHCGEPWPCRIRTDAIATADPDSPEAHNLRGTLLGIADAHK